MNLLEFNLDQSYSLVFSPLNTLEFCLFGLEISSLVFSSLLLLSLFYYCENILISINPQTKLYIWNLIKSQTLKKVHNFTEEKAEGAQEADK